MEVNSFECSKSIKKCKKNNAWNIRPLVNESFVQANHQTRILYCRLSDFKTLQKKMCKKLCNKRKEQKCLEIEKKIHSFPQEWIPQIFISSHMTYDATLYLFQMPLNVQASIFWIIHKLHHCGKIGSGGVRDVNSLTSETRLNIFPHDGTQVKT